MNDNDYSQFNIGISILTGPMLDGFIAEVNIDFRKSHVVEDGCYNLFLFCFHRLLVV